MQLTDQQTKAIDKLRQLKVGALFMHPGTGKTRTAYELIRSIACDRVLWVTPKQTIPNLLAEINKCGGLPHVTAVGCETISQSERTYLELYDLLSKGVNFLVVDESLKVKNADAIRTKRIIELSKLCEYRLILNGTPVTRNLLDIWSQFEILSPKILNMNLAEFTNTFCETVKITKRKNGKTNIKEFIAKYHNVDHLYKLIGNYIYECDLELTIDRLHTEVKYKLSDEDREVYDKLKKKYLDNETLLAMNNNIFLEMTMKMQNNYCCTPDKFVKLDEILKDRDKSKIIVYTKYVKSYKELTNRYPELCVLSYQKHALGLNLQDFNVTIYWDKTFDYSQMTQSEFRTYRKGQTEDCTYIKMTGDVGLEQMIDENIHKKRSLLDYFKQVGIDQITKEL